MQIYAELDIHGGWYLYLQPDENPNARIQLHGPTETFEGLIQEAKFKSAGPIQVKLGVGSPQELRFIQRTPTGEG